MKKIIIITTIFFFALSSFQLSSQPGIKASMERGKKVYEMTCLACHQADGEGMQRMNPTLVKTKWVLGDKKALINIVLNGLKGGEIEIDGENYHNPMPPQTGVLNDQQTADVLTYVRNNFGNKASAVTPAEVKAARSKTKPVATKKIKKA
ncbi:MAG: cytochrome c [Ferruginibacter sp.]